MSYLRKCNLVRQTHQCSLALHCTGEDLQDVRNSDLTKTTKTNKQIKQTKKKTPKISESKIIKQKHVTNSVFQINTSKR